MTLRHPIWPISLTPSLTARQVRHILICFLFTVLEKRILGAASAFVFLSPWLTPLIWLLLLLLLLLPFWSSPSPVKRPPSSPSLARTYAQSDTQIALSGCLGGLRGTAISPDLRLPDGNRQLWYLCWTLSLSCQTHQADRRDGFNPIMTRHTS